MGYSIPVMYLVCDASEAPTNLTSWADAQDILSKAWNDRETYHLHSAAGRNWWQVRTVADLRDDNRLIGLDFIDREIAVVQTTGLTAAIDSLQDVIALCRGRYNIDEVPEQLIPTEIECDDPGGFEQFLGSLLYIFKAARDSCRAVVYVQPQP